MGLVDWDPQGCAFASVVHRPHQYILCLSEEARSGTWQVHVHVVGTLPDLKDDLMGHVSICVWALHQDCHQSCRQALWTAEQSLVHREGSHDVVQV
jgi:hypothetical protein